MKWDLKGQSGINDATCYNTERGFTFGRTCTYYYSIYALGIGDLYGKQGWAMSTDLVKLDGWTLHKKIEVRIIIIVLDS
jgi:hypothetical protein